MRDVAFSYIIHRIQITHCSLYAIRACHNYYQSSDWRGRPMLSPVFGVIAGRITYDPAGGVTS